MPTFFSPGGRTLAGGDKMPWFIPWPEAVAASRRLSARPAIEFEIHFVLRTSCSLSGLPVVWLRPERLIAGSCRGFCGGLRGRFFLAGSGGDAGRAFGPSGQAALRDQVHGPINRDAYGARVFINPIVGQELLILLLDVLRQLRALVGSKTRRRERERVFGSDDASIGIGRDHGAQVDLVLALIDR